MEQQKKLTYITIVYWVMLLYMVAALVWWFIALNRQSAEMAALRIEKLVPGTPVYEREVEEARAFRKRKATQYIGEGSIFLVLIIVGAVFIYKATRRQLQLARQQQNFMMAVTHELKTPIAVTKLNLETLKLRKLDEQKQIQLVQAALAETERLNDLTSNILLASRMETGSEGHFAELFDLSVPVAETIRQFEGRYPGRKFNASLNAGAMVKGDPLLMKLVASNLLENAMKYTPETEGVQVTVGRVNDRVLLQVSDHGPGIAGIEKEKVFEKFYRSGNEATRSTKGTGLGLYLCKKIVESHDGQIGIEDNKPAGAVFTVTIPAA